MSWKSLAVSSCRTHHVQAGVAVYGERFDEVLKFHEPGLAPVRRGDMAWHIRPDGSAAYGRRFRRTFGYYEGLAAVVSDEGWHHVDGAGHEAYGARFGWCGNFQEARCAVRDTAGRYLHITVSGEPVYAGRWSYAGDYREGVAVVQGDGGLSSHIDASGRVIHGRWYLDLDVFHKGFARARDEYGWVHVGLDGVPIHQRRFAMIEPFYNGQARVERFDQTLEVIDEHGETLVVLRRGGHGVRVDSPATKVLLIGLPGAGKTTIGALLAERLRVPCQRLDDMRRKVGDGSIGGEYLARSHFLRRCSEPGVGVFEFSATGYHRVGVRQALRESGDGLLTVWIDTPHEVRRERLANRGTRVPLPDWGIAAGDNDQAIEAKVRGDFEARFWEPRQGWRAIRVDGTRAPEENAEQIARLVGERFDEGREDTDG